MIITLFLVWMLMILSLWYLGMRVLHKWVMNKLDAWHDRRIKEIKDRDEPQA